MKHRLFALIALSTVVIVAFQQCAPARFVTPATSPASPSSSSSSSLPAQEIPLPTIPITSCTGLNGWSWTNPALSWSCMSCSQYVPTNGISANGVISDQSATTSVAPFVGCAQINLGSINAIPISTAPAGNATLVFNSGTQHGVEYELTNNFNCAPVPDSECFP